ncbi:MAG: T9SS type A sorting domain-containing protein [Candidatus Fermentibacteraceae bacterium]|nr:T9SS type A sorting domain-containing protein [Candidatus Fermentibacteraceae bacterium]MBN2608142.1 T9SS type A sorting domain-containing protein [Candidatus Fermentibacteraceae bacterium]
MSEAAAVKLAVYDLSGRRVETPFDQTMQAGSYQHTVDGLCSGLYFARLETGGEMSVRQFLVISGN